VSSQTDSRLRIAAIRFLNPAPLMWDFEHPPLDKELASRYKIDLMLPSECADQLASGAADIGLVPIAALATIPGLRVLPGCTIASKGRVRSLLLVHRAGQELRGLRHVPRTQRAEPHWPMRAFSFTNGEIPTSLSCLWRQISTRCLNAPTRPS